MVLCEKGVHVAVAVAIASGGLLLTSDNGLLAGVCLRRLQMLFLLSFS